MVTEKQLFEKRLDLIFQLLTKGQTNEEIAEQLGISIRSVQYQKRKLEERYTKYQQQKNHDTFWLELSLLKNRLLTLYRNLDRKITDSKTGASDAARAADVAMRIVIEIYNAENRGIINIHELAKVTRDEETKVKLELEKEASIKAAREFIQNNDNGSSSSSSRIEQWRKGPYYKPELDDGSHVEQYLCDGHGLFPGESGYDDNYKF
jgi:DNA-binding Lrp family transcriptional regulator